MFGSWEGVRPDPHSRTDGASPVHQAVPFGVTWCMGLAPSVPGWGPARVRFWSQRCSCIPKHTRWCFPLFTLFSLFPFFLRIFFLTVFFFLLSLLSFFFSLFSFFFSIFLFSLLFWFKFFFPPITKKVLSLSHSINAVLPFPIEAQSENAALPRRVTQHLPRSLPLVRGCRPCPVGSLAAYLGPKRNPHLPRRKELLLKPPWLTAGSLQLRGFRGSAASSALLYAHSRLYVQETII